MSNISKITSIMLYTLMAISIILLIMFYKATSNIPVDTDFDTQMELYGSTLDMFIGWAYILMGIAAVAAILFPIVRMFTRPKEAVKSLLSFAVVAVVVLIAYFLADDKVLHIVAYDGADNVPGTLKFAGTMLWSAYLLIFGVIASILYVEISKIFK